MSLFVYFFTKNTCSCSQALSNQQKAVLMSERVLGIEHPNTIQEYVRRHALCWIFASYTGLFNNVL